MERRTFMAGLAGLVSAGVVDFVPTPHQVGYFPTKEPKASLCLRKLNPISYLNQFNISQKQGLEGGKKWEEQSRLNISYSAVTKIPMTLLVLLLGDEVDP